MKQRQSNMELLRIASITMIVLFHCAYKSGFSFETGLDANMLVVKSLWMLGELGVNLFMLLSGFFMAKGHFRWKKFILLVAEVQFYYWLTVFFAWRNGLGELPTGRDLFLAFFPVTMNRWWFITAYILVYVLSPYLNTLIRAMGGGPYLRTEDFSLRYWYSSVSSQHSLAYSSTQQSQCCTTIASYGSLLCILWARTCRLLRCRV